MLLTGQRATLHLGGTLLEPDRIGEADVLWFDCVDCHQPLLLDLNQFLVTGNTIEDLTLHHRDGKPVSCNGCGWSGKVVDGVLTV